MHASVGECGENGSHVSGGGGVSQMRVDIPKKEKELQREKAKL